MMRKVCTWISIILFQIFTLSLYFSQLYSLKYLFIGDEYAFYLFAKQIAQGKHLPPLLSLNGVYSEYPVLGSYYQAVFLKLFGVSIPHWKMSSLFIIIPLNILSFLIYRKIFKSSLFGWLGMLLTTFSFYYFNFFQIGYLNNLSVLLLYVLAYLFVVIGIQNPSWFLVFLLSIATSLSWYFYLGKLFFFSTLLTWLCLSIFLYKHIPWSKITAFIILNIANISLSFWFTSYPSNFNWPLIGLNKTVLFPEYDTKIQVIKNIIYPFITSFYTSSPTHYLPIRAYLDPLSQILMAVGMVVIFLSFLFKIKPLYKIDFFIKATPFLTFTFITMFLIGITSPYAYPPTTRGIHYFLFYSFFIISSLYVCYSLIRQRLKIWSYLFLVFVTLNIIYFNLYLMNKPLPLNLTQKIFNLIKNTSTSLVVLSPKQCQFNLYNLQILAKGYQLNRPVTINPSTNHNYLPPSTLLVTCQLESCQQKGLNKILLYTPQVSVCTNFSSLPVPPEGLEPPAF